MKIIRQFKRDDWKITTLQAETFENIPLSKISSIVVSPYSGVALTLRNGAVIFTEGNTVEIHCPTAKYFKD